MTNEAKRISNEIATQQEQLKEQHPKIVFFEYPAKNKNGVIFEIGDYVVRENAPTKILGRITYFDIYNHPTSGIMVRAICFFIYGHTHPFYDINELEHYKS